MCLRSLHVILLRARVAMLYIFKYNNYSFNTYFLNNSSVVEIGSISYYSHTVQYIILHAWASTSARGGNLVLFTKPFCNHMKGWNFPHEQREVIILNYVQHSRDRSDWTVGDEQIEGVVCKNKKKTKQSKLWWGFTHKPFAFECMRRSLSAEMSCFANHFSIAESE